MEKPTIFFRADASSQIGYGHFIRSLALAEMLKNDFAIYFATVNPTDYQLNELSTICQCIPLNASSHFEDFLSLLKGNEIVVTDNYFFTTEYQQKIKDKGCKLVCIDDIHDKHYVADIVINHGVDDPSLFSVEPYTDLCLGIRWALLRKPFIEASPISFAKNEIIKNIVISFGGVDYHDITNMTIKRLKALRPEIRIDAIIGGGYSGNIENSDKIRFHRTVSAQQVANLFRQCDLAILSASTVCLEAIACKAKVAAGYYVDNQLDFYNYLVKNNLIYGLDNLLNTNVIDIESIQKYNPSTIEVSNVAADYINCFQSLWK